MNKCMKIPIIWRIIQASLFHSVIPWICHQLQNNKSCKQIYRTIHYLILILNKSITKISTTRLLNNNSRNYMKLSFFQKNSQASLRI
ncbi:unnamed protein product [Paramecium octaurelia]|uniref:Uncharacterized protein n=1 Tax=Paramecium octaurelia TaxID=43137 RepID=A0A8S1RZD7_PAROT|nr:unnamed protein product [Paramecium octaurelia]